MKQIVKACLFLFMFMGVSGVSLADEKQMKRNKGPSAAVSSMRPNKFSRVLLSILRNCTQV